MKTEKELKKGTMGTASLVCGILGLFLVPGVLSTLAIIFGAIGRNRNEKYSTAGIVLGIIGLACVLLATLVMMILFLAVFTSV